MHFYGISLPPGQGPAKLEGLAVGEDLVVEKSTKPSRIMAAYLEACPGRGLTRDGGKQHLSTLKISFPWETDRIKDTDEFKGVLGD